MNKKKMMSGICVLLMAAVLVTAGASPAFAASAETQGTAAEDQKNNDGRIYVNNVLYSGYYMDESGVLYLVSDGVPEAKTGTVNAGTSYYDCKTGKTLMLSKRTVFVAGKAYTGYYTDTAGILYRVSGGTPETRTGTVSAGTSYYDYKSGKTLKFSKSTVFVKGRVYTGYYTDSAQKMYRVTNGAKKLKSGVLNNGTRYYSYKSGKTLTISKQTLYVKGKVHTGYYLGKSNKMYRARKGRITLKSGIVNAKTRYYSGKSGKMRTLSKRTLYVNGKAYTGYYLGKNNKMYRAGKGKLTLKTGTISAGSRYYSGKSGKMRTLSKQMLYVNGKAYTGYYLGKNNKMYYASGGTRALINTTLGAGTPYYSYNAGRTLTLPSLMVYVNGKAMEGMSAESLITLQRAQAVVNSITTDNMTKEEKLSVCFEFVKTYRESNPRIPHYRGLDWPIVYANDMFVNGTGNCFSYAAAFAYMAKAIGYEEVYCCNDGHGWAEIDGLVYDPEWSKHHHVYSYYALSYDAQTDQNYKWILSVGKDWMRIKI